MMTPGGQQGEVAHFSASVEGLNDNYRDILAQEHGLAVVGDTIVGELEISRHSIAAVDAAFARANPSTPAENVASRLDNYEPRNQSQEQLLIVAQRLVVFHGTSRLAGVIACGTAGTGKTHIAVGVAKESMLRGGKPAYINIPRTKGLGGTMAEQIAAEADIVILDDVNSQYGLDADFVRQLIPAMHDKGSGKLLITSNFPGPDELVEGIAKGVLMNEAQVARLRDRVSGALLGVTLEGESYRREIQENQAPWWMEDLTSDIPE